MIPPVRPSLTGDALEGVLNELSEALSSGILTGGPRVRELERKLSGYIGRKCLALSSGTLALEAVLSTMPKGKVILQANTYIAAFNAVIRSGHRPVLVDIDEYLGPDPEGVSEALTKDVSAVIVTHVGGIVSPGIGEILEACEDLGVAVVEDFSHALGSSLGGRMAGSLGHAGAASLYATKVLTSAEGGVACGPDEVLKRVRLFRDNGRDPENPLLSRSVGTSARMDELRAVLALHNLSRLEWEISIREKIAQFYTRKLGELGLEVQPVPEGLRNNWYKFIFFHDDPRGLRERMAERGVRLPSGVYECPLNLQPPVRELLGDMRFPKTEDFARSHACLPIYSSLWPEGAARVIEALEEAL